jgi:hypothetical protein
VVESKNSSRNAHILIHKDNLPKDLSGFRKVKKGQSTNRNQMNKQEALNSSNFVLQNSIRDRDSVLNMHSISQLNHQLHLYSHRLTAADQAGRGLTSSSTTASHMNRYPMPNPASQDQSIMIADQSDENTTQQDTLEQRRGLQRDQNGRSQQ